MARYKKVRPTYEEVSRLLAYNADTGVLTWKVRRSNRIKAGDIAGYSRENENGRHVIMIDYVNYFAHQLIWLLVHGEWPSEDKTVDHRSCDAGNNRLTNLRLATWSDQVANRRMRRTKGVTRHMNGSYRAKIYTNGRHIHLGYFPTFDKAKFAYDNAARNLFGEFYRP